jgi:hypothetical protein
LAPSFGSLDAQNVMTLDDSVKVMIAGVVRALSRIPPTELTYEKVLETLMQTIILEPTAESVVERADKFKARSETRAGSKKSATVKKLNDDASNHNI